MKHFNDLPDDCIILILKQCHYPLQKLITLRSVCKRWHSIIISQLCHRKRTLKLFGSVESDLITYCNFLIDYNLESNDRFRLKPIGKDDDMVVRNDCEHNYLVDLFPAVENLVVYLTRFSSRMFNMPYLLENLSCLTSLTLIYMPYPIDLQHQVWSAINSLETLKELNLFYIFQCTIPEAMPILSRLERFSLDGYYGDIVSVMKQLGPGLRHLHLDDIHCSVEQLAEVVGENPGLTESVSHLTIGSINLVKPVVNNLKKRQIFDFICGNFRKIECLAFTAHALYTLDEVLASLERLPALQELHLPNSWYGPNRSGASIPSQQLQTVKSLHLAFSPSADDAADHFPRNVSLFTIFPHVEEVTVSGSAKLLADAHDVLEHYHKKGWCSISYCLKSDDVSRHIGRHHERYQKYLDDLDKYGTGY